MYSVIYFPAAPVTLPDSHFIFSPGLLLPWFCFLCQSVHVSASFWHILSMW